jgi:signal transduction histidine kinase
VRDRAPVRRSDAAVALAAVALTAGELVLAGTSGDHARLAGGLALVTAAATVARRAAPVEIATAVAVATTAAFALGGRPGDVPNAMLLSLALIAYALGEHASARASGYGVAVLLLGTYGAQIVTSGNPTPPLLFAVSGPYIAGAVVRSRRTLAARLEETIGELDAERASYVELAIERERRYIARELHDIVGHAMSLIVIQATAGRHLATAQPDQASDALNAIIDAGLQARTEVGRLRGLLDSDERGAGLDRAPAVLAQAAAAGLRVTVDGDHAVVNLTPEADHAAFRALQEALTNAIKHAHGAQVSVKFAVSEELLRFEVRNGPGEGATTWGPGGGHGLQGMAERLRSVGGSLEAGPEGDGWRIRATVPCHPRVSPLQ